MAETCERLYMMVSKDRYELPLAIGESMGELARTVGVSVSVISRCLRNARLHGARSRYVEVELGGEEDG